MKKTDQSNESKQDLGYWERRTHLMYYQYVDFMVRALAKDAKSLIDVGSADAQYIENFDWIAQRNTLDLRNAYSSETVESIEMDFFDFEPEEKYDFATCLQVLEHIPDAKSFARKLFEIADRVLISVPYYWEKGRTKSHVHDPVDMDKLLDWTGREPDYYIVVKEPLLNHHYNRRLISYYHPKGEKLEPAKARKNARRVSPVRNGTSENPSAQLDRERQLREVVKHNRAKNKRLKERLEEKEAALAEVRKNYNKAIQEQVRLNHSYAAIQKSRTWRYTLPVRKIGSVLKRLARR